MAAPQQQVVPTLNLNMILDQVAKDKGIERDILVDTLQNAIAQAAKKHFGPDRAIEATYNEEKGVVEVFQTLTVVPRVEVEDPIKSVNQI
ncbi:MAG: transcription termination factor NusA, partial [Deltaproteobacteria bacterium]